MDSESAMTAALIDPQLELTVQGTTAEGMQYYQALSTSTAFELWNFMFESIGELPQPAQDMGLMGSDLHSDETSSLSLSLSTEQDMQFPLSPLDGSANFDESPGGTSMSPGLSEAGTLSTDQKTPKAKEAKKARRRRSETEKKEQIKQRNRVAASKCRRKKKATVDELKEMKSSLEARNKTSYGVPATSPGDWPGQERPDIPQRVQ
ncbi:tan spore [Trichoderma gamsii]|uniref:Tan spore n=1 Tax=Trichoderma gamsii TaxID=398673 RepID=A0A2P4Z7I6_9HYPO|nr:tan spore [Trichoderma gamsii]PON20259.1 tan spore [Trichoderma gamsii]